MAENIFGWLFSRFVESIHIELSNETIDVAMPEIFGQNSFLKLLNVLNSEFFAISGPLDNFGVLMILC